VEIKGFEDISIFPNGVGGITIKQSGSVVAFPTEVVEQVVSSIYEAKNRLDDDSDNEDQDNE